MVAKCNKENMLKVCEAMESGEYPQGKHRLRSTPSEYGTPTIEFCCAGVACETSGLGYWAENTTRYMIAPTGDSQGEGNSFYLTPSVIKWLGLSHRPYADHIPLGPTGRIRKSDDVWIGTPDNNQIKSAVHMNDAGKSFKEIAAAIRKYYGLGPPSNG